MSPRIYALTILAALAATPVLAQEYNFTHDIAGAKLDETSRDSPYINDATTAGDHAADQAMRDRTAVKHVQPEHRVVLHRENGRTTTTDLYFIPPSAAEASGDITQ